MEPIDERSEKPCDDELETKALQEDDSDEEDGGTYIRQLVADGYSISDDEREVFYPDA